MRHAARMARGAPSRETRHREIKTAPEEMYRARLANEAGAEVLEHPVGVDKDLKKTPHRIRIVRGVLVVLRKPDRLRQFVRHLIYRDVNAEFGETSHDRCVETRDRLSGESELQGGAATGRNPQNMIDKVEIELKAARAVRYWRGAQAARGDVQRDLPGMVQPGSASQTNLADDLGPQQQ